MATIQQKELRNQVGDVLRRVEAGETMVITVAGREVAELAPVRRRTWVSGSALAAVWRAPVPRGLLDDVAELPGGAVDPYER